MAKDPFVTIEGGRIDSLDSFHDAVAQAFGFPDWYGRGWDALDDLLYYLGTDQNAATLRVEPNEVVTIMIDHVSEMRERVPEILDGFIQSCAFVNWARLEQNMTAHLCLAFYK